MLKKLSTKEFVPDNKLALGIFLAGFDKRKIDEIRKKTEEKSLNYVSDLNSNIKKCDGTFSNATEWLLSDVIEYLLKISEKNVPTL